MKKKPKISKDIQELAERIMEIHAAAEKAGVFVDDRDLLSSHKMGLSAHRSPLAFWGYVVDILSDCGMLNADFGMKTRMSSRGAACVPKIFATKTAPKDPMDETQTRAVG